VTIKSKLYLNMLITIVGIIVIAGFSLAGMKFVQSKLSVLTEKSTPYQLKTIELQRAVQEHTSNLLKVAAATTPQELSTARGELDKTLVEVKNLSSELATFKGSSTDGGENKLLDDLGSITTEMVAIVAEKIMSRDEAKKADAQMKGKLQQIGLKLKELDSAMKKLQKGSMGHLTMSNQSVKQISQRVKNVQAAMNSINDVKISLLEIAAAENKTGVTVARSHFTVASRWVTTGALAKTEKDSSAVKGLIDNMNDIAKMITGTGGLIETKNALLAAPSDDLKKRFSETNASAMQKLSQMTVLMGDLVEKAAEVNTTENKRFDDSLKGTESASDIMAMNSDLVSLGGDIRNLTKELFDAETPQELAAVKTELERKFGQAESLQKKMPAGRKGQELRQLHEIAAGLQEIKVLLLAQNGVAAKLQRSHEVTRKALELNDKLKATVVAQREAGKKGMNSAQEEQSKAVKAVNSVFRSNIATVSLVGLAVLVLGILVSTLLARSITTPIRALSDMAEKFGNGDFSSRLDDHRKDEFGLLAGHFNQATEKLREITGALSNAISNLAANSRDLTKTAEELNRGALHQATQVAQAATAMTEMNQTIHEVAQNANSAAEATSNSLNIASGGKKTVEKTVHGMEEIAQAVRQTAESISQLGASSERIGDIVNTINEIADQTNLLALNAAIEAARAGDAGRGFAVVADEVRRLAERTTEATAEIGGMVHEIQGQTRQSVQSMENGTKRVEEGVVHAGEASQALASIVEASGQGADMVTRIATAAEEQSATAAEVSHSMEQIEEITRKTEASTSEINRAAQELARLANELNTMAAWFKGS
jgi:methyl-accepting chemotaxis protein